MKNALILHGTDFQKDKKQHFRLSSNPDFKQFPELLELIKNNLDLSTAI